MLRADPNLVRDGSHKGNTKMTKWRLFTAFCNGERIRLQGAPRPGTPISTIEGIISSIEREDGSGLNFNVTLRTGLDSITVFVRTVD